MEASSKSFMQTEIEENGLLRMFEAEREVKERIEEECRKLREDNKRLEEEGRKMKREIERLEGSLGEKTLELESLRKESEGKICALYEKLGKYKTAHGKCEKEIQSLHSSLGSLKSDYFKATDAEISRSTKIDELYQLISTYRNEMSSLRSQLLCSQNEISELEKEKYNLLKLIDIKKESKFIQTDFSYSMIVPATTHKKSFSTVKSSPSLPSSVSLTKLKSQMLSLQKSKARLDMQLTFLSSINDS